MLYSIYKYYAFCFLFQICVLLKPVHSTNVKKTHVHVAKKSKNNRNKYDVIWLISVAGSVFCPRQGVGGAFLGATAFGKKLWGLGKKFTAFEQTL